MRRACLSSLWALIPLLATTEAWATHHYASAMRYRVPDPVAAPLTVELELDIGYRASFGPDAAGLAFDDGDSGSSAGVDIGSPGLGGGNAPGYQVARHVYTHTFPSQGPYAPWYATCCAASAIQNAGSNSIWASLAVDLAAAPLGSAIMAIPPVVFFQTPGIRSYFIPVKAPGNAAFTCRFSTTAESSYATNPAVIVNGAGPTIANVSDGCLLTWDTEGAVPDNIFAVSVAVDVGEAGAVATAFSDVLIHFVTSPVPDCSGSGVFNVEVGSTLTLPFQATSSTGADLSLESIGLLGALTPPEGSSGAQPLAANLTFSPVSADIGIHALNVIYRDDLGVDGSCAAVIEVGPCPVQGQPCTAGEGVCAASGTTQCGAGQITCDAVLGEPMEEECNGLDDDCDGVVDEDVCDVSGTGGAGGAGGGGGQAPEAGGGGEGGAGGGAGPSDPQVVDGCGCRVAQLDQRWGAGGLLTSALVVLARRRRARCKQNGLEK